MRTLTRGFGSPGKYIQGPGELGRLRHYTDTYGRSVSALIDGVLFDEIERTLAPCYREEHVLECVRFSGECCANTIRDYKASVASLRADVVVGIGGGKTLDTAKAVAAALSLPVIIVPTSASTDAPTSASSVIYTDDGVYMDYVCHARHPEIVLVDTEIVCKAPVRLLVSGMGDALSTYFEAEANARSDTPNYVGEGYKRTRLSLEIARLCYSIIIEEGLYAKISAENGCCSGALEDVIEANILLSGLGYENTGCAGAHGINVGLTALYETRPYYHGEKVAFGTICQLVLENQPPSLIEEVIDFCLSVGLPVTLAQLGVEPTEEKMTIVARLAVETIESEPFLLTEQSVVHAIKTADSLGRMYRDRVART